MTRLAAAFTVLLIHTGAAYAQQFPTEQGPFAAGPGAPPPAAGPPQSAPAAGPPAPAPAPPPSAAPAGPPSSDYPPGYGPPPGYIPPTGYGPPPAYGAPPMYAPPPRPYGYGPRSYAYHYPPPQMRLRSVTDRPFTIGGGIGFGGLQLNQGGTRTSETGMAYTARLGLGLRPGLILMWDIEGSVVDRGASVFSQTAQLAALQIFIGDRLFLKGGFGLAQVNQDDLNYSTWGGAMMGGVGVELIQGWNWSLDVESTLTAARYTIAGNDETWLNWSIANFAINFF